jgi:hypothetical protein
MITETTQSMTAAPSGEQLSLINLADFDGFGQLSRREQKFAEGIFEGMSQRAAAKYAGVPGSEEVLDQAGHVLMRNRQVQRLLAQAWGKSGASIHQTLAQAARMQQRAAQDWEAATNKEARRDAFKEWQAASALIASIHGKLTLNVNHGGAVEFAVPAAALTALAAVRREVVVSSQSIELKEGAA